MLALKDTGIKSYLMQEEDVKNNRIVLYQNVCLRNLKIPSTISLVMFQS